MRGLTDRLRVVCNVPESGIEEEPAVWKPTRKRLCVRNCFSLIEVLTVVVVIAILGSILLSAIGSARTAALVSVSKTRFAQWMGAMEAFRLEYGYYPVGGVGSDSSVALHEGGMGQRLVSILEGRNEEVNPRRVPFIRFTDQDFADPSDPDSVLVDALGQRAIHVLVDGDGDGRIRVAGYDFRGSLGMVSAPDPGTPGREVRTWE